MIHSTLAQIEGLRQRLESGLLASVGLKDGIYASYMTFSRQLEYWALRAKRILSKGRFPDFLIIGAQKGGTTSLWQNLQRHSCVEMSPNFSELLEIGLDFKEPCFFDQRFDRGYQWYRSLFNDNGCLQGEASPNYISCFNAHHLMYATVPKAKLILVLRDPVTRAYSAYNHQRSVGQNWERGFETSAGFDGWVESLLGMRQHYPAFFRRGLYFDQIRSILRWYPRNQLLILISEKIWQNPVEEYSKIFDFLGVPFELPHSERANHYGYPAQLSRRACEILNCLYRIPNRKLFDFLGYQVEEWGH